MHIDDKNNDINLDSFSDDDLNFENLFEEPEASLKSSEKKPVHKTKPASEKKPQNKISSFEDFTASEPAKKKRTISDFEPDMDALLMTAQSSMIIEGMEHYSNKDFSSEALQVYIEAFKGVDLYIKILNRNPNNYRKLKKLIDSDTDCQQVEKFAFELYKEQCGSTPNTDKEKLEAFELFKQIFKQSINKSSISKSMKLLRKYFLLSGGLDTEKIQELINSGSLELKREINYFHQHLHVALDMLKKGDSEIVRGLKGRDLNVFITKSSELLGHYYKTQDNIKISDYYFRIYTIYKKYFIIKQ
ncbi:MAG: hypothetical protein V1874_03510 [Spirochaetota bacterium]